MKKKKRRTAILPEKGDKLLKQERKGEMSPQSRVVNKKLLQLLLLLRPSSPLSWRS